MSWLSDLADKATDLKKNLFPNDDAFMLADPFSATMNQRDDPAHPTGGRSMGLTQKAMPADSLLTAEAMPSLTDSDRRTAGRKARSRILARGGRASTILTDDFLGGGL